jgi:hypothetical protein
MTKYTLNLKLEALAFNHLPSVQFENVGKSLGKAQEANDAANNEGMLPLIDKASA